MNDSRWLYQRLRSAAVALPVAATTVHCGAAAQPFPPGFDPAGTHANPVILDTPSVVEVEGEPDAPPGGHGVSAADLERGVIPDVDHDGVVGSADACPFDAEDQDYWDDYDGCPDPDNDGDGIDDGDDSCPMVAETVNGRADEDGCPEYSAYGYGAYGYPYNSHVIRGRPLVDEGINLRADTHIASTWVEARADDLSGGLDQRERRVLARRWIRDGRLEHASVASFARASLELMALGAPPELVAGSHQAALDEINHATRCFGLAARYANAPRSPGPMQVAGPRTLTLAQLAAHTFLEGCVEETVATLCALRQSEGCIFPAVRDVLGEIVEDEARHAALAWRTVAWALREGGADVADALRAAAHTAMAEVAQAATRPAREPAIDPVTLRRHGRLTGEAERKTALDAWESIIAPLLDEAISAAST